MVLLYQSPAGIGYIIYSRFHGLEFIAKKVNNFRATSLKNSSLLFGILEALLHIWCWRCLMFGCFEKYLYWFEIAASGNTFCIITKSISSSKAFEKKKFRWPNSGRKRRRVESSLGKESRRESKCTTSGRGRRRASSRKATSVCTAWWPPVPLEGSPSIFTLAPFHARTQSKRHLSHIFCEWAQKI